MQKIVLKQNPLKKCPSIYIKNLIILLCMTVCISCDIQRNVNEKDRIYKNQENYISIDHSIKTKIENTSYNETGNTIDPPMPPEILEIFDNAKDVKLTQKDLTLPSDETEQEFTDRIAKQKKSE